MKRLDIIVKLDKVNSVVEAINKVGVGGITILHARGQGTTDPPLVGQSYSREIIIVIVDDSKVDKLKSAISSAACTKLRGDGKIFVSNVENAFDICSGSVDSNAI
jgi:nitrogen regulatory protein P-II 1|tara:strand:+ start:525 stop:839 length:315 start_codon:yes stop_codon:yes gene_type:complete